MTSKRSAIALGALFALAINIVLVSTGHAQRAALTRDVDRSSAQPVNGNCFTSTKPNGITQCQLYVVPAGRRLVVETVGHLAYVAPNSCGVSDPVR